ncbi:MAG: hypothetical protein QNJ19_09415 [Woeseiaceae bacterium]|nr:hypothetical protein [Woeseiaceae bacterium]
MRLLLLILLLPGLSFAQDDDFWDEEWEDEEAGLPFAGFIEAGAGFRLQDDPFIDRDLTLADLRARLEAEWTPGRATLSLKADAWYDDIENGVEAEVRDLSVAFRVGDNVDVKIGRQVQTWGTGDLVFLNDLFPKDFVSFFSGRDDEYLKAPGNSIRLSRFGTAFNVDLVWSPVFDPDIYLDGNRYSFFSPVAGGNVAPSPPLSALEPDEGIGDGEFALRVFRNIEGNEYAAYAYRGYFKQPNALTASLVPTFAPLAAFGASLRRPMGPGLFNAEVVYYSSLDDRDGTDPLLPNDQFRALAGYEWEARPNFTVGLQYYLEATLDYDELEANSPNPTLEPDRYRHLLTNRLTYRAARDRHTFSLFTFFSPSDSDYYLRPAYTYRHSDQWSLTAGGNLFGGDEPQTFFNQLSDATNVYLRVRFNY